MNKRELLDQAVYATERRFNNTGEVVPMYDAIDRDGVRFFFPMPKVETKDIAVALVRIVFHVRGVTSYVFMGEGWSLQKAPSETSEADEERWKTVGISEEPGREEVLMYLAEDAEGMLRATRPIIRENGKATLGPLEICEVSEMEGRMVGLLSTTGLAH